MKTKGMKKCEGWEIMSVAKRPLLGDKIAVLHEEIYKKYLYMNTYVTDSCTWSYVA